MTSCNESKISTKTGSRWLEQYHATGSILPVRHRDSIAGQMPYEDQEALFTLIANNRTAHIDELSQLLLEDTGHFHTERLVRQIMFRQKYSYKLANHLAPLERDPELRRYWIEEVLGGEANLTSDMFLFVDESSKKLKDCIKTCHRSHIVPFSGSEPVKPNAKETAVELFDRSSGRLSRVSFCDGRPFRDVPSLRAPLLKKIRITLRV